MTEEVSPHYEVPGPEEVPVPFHCIVELFWACKKNALVREFLKFVPKEAFD
jgi:hypothetical protein